MVEIKSSGIMRLEKQGQEKFSGMSKAKSMRGWINGMLSKYSKAGNTEMEFVFREVLNAYNNFHPEKVLEVEVDKWKGRSSFEIIKGMDRITIIKFQKKQKGEEPTEVRVEVSKEELIALIQSIRQLAISQKSIETKEIALGYCLLLDIRYNDKGRDLFEGGHFWENFFASRNLHNKLTLMLGAFDKLSLIKYSGGKTEVIEKDISIQMIL